MQKKYKGLNNFKINCGQHHLLIGEFSITINGLESNLLKNNKYDTGTTYSVLYKDDKNMYNFDLSSAKSVICNDCSNKNSMCCIEKGKYRWANHQYSQLQKGKDEYISHTNIEEILKNFIFGEKIRIQKDKEKLNELIKIMKTFDNSDDILKMLDIPLYGIQKEYICNKDKNNTHANVGFLIGINEIKSTTK